MTGAGCFRTCSLVEYLGCSILLASMSRSSPISVYLSWAVGVNPFPQEMLLVPLAEAPGT